MMLADLPRRIVTFDDYARESPLRGYKALMMMPLRFTTGDFQRFARMFRVEAEQALDELSTADHVIHVGNQWQRIGDTAATIGSTGATGRRMDFIWLLPPQWISAPDFAMDALTHNEVARQFLIDKWTRREAEKTTRLKKSGSQNVKMHMFRRLLD